MRVFVGIGVVVLLIAGSAGAGAAGGSARGKPIGADFRISGPDAISTSVGSAVAWNQTNNQYLVVWEEGRDGWHDIYGRRVRANGKPIGADFRISGPDAIFNEGSPAVAWNQTNNQYLVVWQDERNYTTTPTSDIYGRRVRANGKPSGGDFRISGSTATSWESEPAVAWNQTNNQYLVVWQDERDFATRGRDIYGRRVRANGKPSGGDFRITGPKVNSHEFTPAVAWNQTNNQYLVVWEDYRNWENSWSDIYGRRLRANGKPAGGAGVEPDRQPVSGRLGGLAQLGDPRR